MNIQSILVHGIGWLGTYCCIAAYQCKSSKKLVFFELICAFLYMIHYFFLGAYTGSLTMFLSFFANTISCGDRGWMRRKFWPLVFAASFMVSAFFTWDGFLSLLPCVASILTCAANFVRNGKLIRLNRLCMVCPMWMIYNIASHSWSGVVCEFFVAASILLSIYRYGIQSLDRSN